MWRQRLKEVIALAMIGEGSLGLANPSGHLNLWKFGPAGYRRMMSAMETHPATMRLLFALELGVGFFWALAQVNSRGALNAAEDRTESNERHLEHIVAA